MDLPEQVLWYSQHNAATEAPAILTNHVEGTRQTGSWSWPNEKKWDNTINSEKTIKIQVLKTFRCARHIYKDGKKLYKSYTERKKRPITTPKTSGRSTKRISTKLIRTKHITMKCMATKRITSKCITNKSYYHTSNMFSVSAYSILWKRDGVWLGAA